MKAIVSAAYGSPDILRLKEVTQPVPRDGEVLVRNHASVVTAAVFDGSITALPFLRDRARLQRGQTILINGASGAVGTAAIQPARHYGTIVTAVCSTAHLELAKTLGAHSVIDRTRDDFTRNLDTYDVIFDTVGSSSFGRSRRALKSGGIYLTTVPTLPILLQMLWTKRIGRKKAAIVFTGLGTPTAMALDLAVVAGLAEFGAFIPVVDTEHPLGRAAEAHRHVETGHKYGSAVITIGTAA